MGRKATITHSDYVMSFGSVDEYCKAAFISRATYYKRLNNSGNYKKKTQQTGIYFVLCDGFVKIGWTCWIEKRLESLQIGSPHEQTLLAFCSCDDRSLESEIHRDLAPWHVRGEWFRYEGKAKTYIDLLIASTRNKA